MKKGIAVIVGLFLLSLVLAVPSLPHTFIGTVTYSQNPGMNLAGYDISASVGSYGLGIVGKVAAGNTYEILIDPQGRTGEITFYVGGVEAEETEDYSWGGHTEDFVLTIDEMPSNALCGNGIQEPGEQCDGTDLGVGTCENVLGIVGATGILGCTNICTFEYSNCTAPFCGDGVCNNGESCSTCSQDCGTCGGSSSGSSGGGSSSSGSGSSNNKDDKDDKVIYLSADKEEDLQMSVDEELELTDLVSSDEDNKEDDSKEGSDNNFLGNDLGAIIVVLIFILRVIIVAVMSNRMKQQKKIKEAVKNIKVTKMSKKSGVKNAKKTPENE